MTKILFCFLFLIPGLAHAMEINLNGFGSAYYAQASSPNLYPASFHDNRPDFLHFSQMGLNITGKVSDEFSFASQLIATGHGEAIQSNYGMYAQWAFLNWRPTDSISLKLGRQLFPIWLASEYFRVGYLLPYRQVPYFAYNLAPFSVFDGLSAEKSFDVSIGKLTLGVFVGIPILEGAIAGVNFKFSDLYGVKATLDGNGWRLYGETAKSGSKADVTFLNPFTGKPVNFSEEGHTYNYSFGYRFDQYGLVSWGEIGVVGTPDGQVVPLPTNTSNTHYIEKGVSKYILIGYHLGDFTPRYTYTTASIKYGLDNGDVVSHTFGLNYKFTSQAVAKVEYELFSIPSPSGGPSDVKQKSNETTAGAFYAGVDFIF